MPDQPLDILFASELPIWPLDQGFKVHGSQMAAALASLGLRVGIATLRPTTGDLPDELKSMLVPWPDTIAEDRNTFRQGWAGRGEKLRYRWADHQGLDPEAGAGLAALVRKHQPRAVIALGQHGPAYLRGLKGLPESDRPRLVWYAADEPIAFQLSCIRRESLRNLPRRARLIAIYGLLETLFTRGLDGAIGVSAVDTRLLKLLTGVKQAACIPNGVDLEQFTPDAEPAPDPQTLVFWGRLDFEPNIDAVRWFAKDVWPKLRFYHPTSTFRIVGKNAVESVRQLGDQTGIEFVGEVDDIKVPAKAAAATILPMRCGAGIKNKLLEAAAMGLPILASPRATNGLSLPECATHAPPVMVCRDEKQWVDAIRRVWTDPRHASAMRRAAREWVVSHHDWTGAATNLAGWLSAMDPKLPVMPATQPRVAGRTEPVILQTEPAAPHRATAA